MRFATQREWLKSSSRTFGEQALEDAINCAKHHLTSTQMDGRAREGKAAYWHNYPQWCWAS